MPDVDYFGNIHLRIDFSTQDVVGTPGMAHAKFGSSFFDGGDILTEYHRDPVFDDAGCGTADSFHRFVMVSKPLVQAGAFCGFTLSHPNGAPSGSVLTIAFVLKPGNCNTGDFITDASAQLTVVQLTPSGPVFKDVGASNLFLYDFDQNVYFFFLSLDGLAPGTYVATVRGDKLSPQSTKFTVTATAP